MHALKFFPALLLASALCLAGCSRGIGDTPPSSAPLAVATPAREEDRYTGLVLTEPRIPDDITGELRRLNEALSKDLQPRDNAAVWLVQAMGIEVFDEPFRGMSLEILGIKALSPERSHYRSPEEFIAARSDEDLTSHSNRAAALAAPLKAALARCRERPWMCEQNPEVADYLDFVRDSLQTAVDATRKPRLFFPAVTLQPSPNILSVEMFLERPTGQMCQVLVARAQLRAGSGDIRGALEDALAIRRLGALVAQGGSCFHHLLAAGIESSAYYPERDWIEGGLVDSDEARWYLTKLRRLAPFPTSGRMFDPVEKGVVVDGIAALKAGEWHSFDFSGPPPEDARGSVKALLAHPAIQWDVVLSASLEEFDRTRDAIDEPDRDVRRTRLGAVEERLEEWRKTSPWELAADSLTLSLRPEEASRAIGRTIALMAMPAYTRAREGEDRREEREIVREVSLALLIYRHERGRYPDSLADLTPDYFPAEPLDAATGRSLTYQKTGPDSIRLWSWGLNGTDDGGQPYHRERTTDDWPLTLGGTPEKSPEEATSRP